MTAETSAHAEETVVNRFVDRRIIVTGGGSGIGQGTVLRLLAEGGQVHAIDVNADGLEDGEFRPLTPTEVYDLMAQASR